MATGASAAKRDAKRAAAAQYYKALKETKRMNQLNTLDTNVARKINDSMSGDMSATSKRLARQADNLGREINKENTGFNEGVNDFNSRWDDLQTRLASGELSAGYRNLDNLTSTFDELNFLSKKAAGYESSINSTPERAVNIDPKTGAPQSYVDPKFGAQQPASVQSGQYDPNTGTVYYKEKPYNWEAMRLNENSSGAKVANLSPQYEALAIKLKKSLEKDNRSGVSPTTQTGLLGSEVLTGTGNLLANEVIK